MRTKEISNDFLFFFTLPTKDSYKDGRIHQVPYKEIIDKNKLNNPLWLKEEKQANDKLSESYLKIWDTNPPQVLTKKIEAEIISNCIENNSKVEKKKDGKKTGRPRGNLWSAIWATRRLLPKSRARSGSGSPGRTLRVVTSRCTTLAVALKGSMRFWIASRRT